MIAAVGRPITGTTNGALTWSRLRMSDKDQHRPRASPL
jgi:hypothetical protein